MVLSDAIGPGDRVTIDALKGELRFDVDTGAGQEAGGPASGRSARSQSRADETPIVEAASKSRAASADRGSRSAKSRSDIAPARARIRSTGRNAPAATHSAE
jgi:hypothetical protein